MLWDILLDTALDAVKLLPFLFLAYLAIEWIEDRAEEKTVAIIRSHASWGPVIGAGLGVVPQCGFSAAVSNLYAGGLITLHELCEREDCHCEDGILRSALKHTLKIFAFLFAVTFAMNLAVELLGAERLGSFILNRPVAGELLAGLIGLIPNCAASVVLTTLYLQGGISAGAMVSGLLVGSGVGLLVLLRMDRDRKDDLITLGILYGSGVLLGMAAGFLKLF